jgi:hypothetical protein
VNYLLVKDETRNPPKKYLQLAAAPDLHGPFGKLSAPIDAAGAVGRRPDRAAGRRRRHRVLRRLQTKHYGAMRSRDLVHWEDVTDKMHFPTKARRCACGTARSSPCRKR